MVSDHCTGWFEGSWAHCCARHDLDYADPLVERLTADLDLATCVAAVGGWPMAILMFAGITAFGWFFRWRWFRRNPPASPAAASGLFHAPRQESAMAEIVDPHRYDTSTAAGPASRVFAVAPSNTADIPFVTTGLYVGGAGDVALRDRATGQSVVFKAVPAGTILPIRIARVLATGTTATDIVGLA